MTIDELIEVLQICRHGNGSKQIEMHIPDVESRLKFRPINSMWVGVSGVVYLSTESAVDNRSTRNTLDIPGRAD